MSSILVPNFPRVAKKNCSCDCDTDSVLEFGNIFSDRALYKLTKEDSLCGAYDKINANFKMLADGYLALAQAIVHRADVPFGAITPVSYQGSFWFNTTEQRLYVWDGAGTGCYVPAHGCNTTISVIDKVAEPFTPNNNIPSLANLRDLCETGLPSLDNEFGLMKVTFVNSMPSCPVGLIIFNKATKELMVWSPQDGIYVATGDNATTSGDVFDVVDRT